MAVIGLLLAPGGGVCLLPAPGGIGCAWMVAGPWRHWSNVWSLKLSLRSWIELWRGGVKPGRSNYHPGAVTGLDEAVKKDHVHLKGCQSAMLEVLRCCVATNTVIIYCSHGKHRRLGVHKITARAFPAFAFNVVC